MFETACPHCGRGFNVRDDWRGKRAKCQSCGTTFAIAEAEPPVLLTDDSVVDEYELEPLAAATTDPLSAALFESDSQHSAPAPGFIARRSTCSDPGKIALSREKLDLLVPGFFTPWGRLKRLVLGLIHQQIHTAHAIEQQLWYGDSRAAVVMSRDPLLVAAYTDEFDASVLLRFSRDLAVSHRLEIGARLLTVNMYWTMHKTPPTDIERGPRTSGNFCNVVPLIADFLSEDDTRLEARKREITEDEWQRAAELGADFMRQYPGKARNGSPLRCHVPCVFKVF